MGQFIRSDDPKQTLLLPPSIRDWLPKDHLCWFVSDSVEALDIDPILDRYRTSGKGELAYHPRLLLKLLVYSYCTGVFSSRKIARQVEENVAFRVLAAGLFPSHRTICRFREDNLGEFHRLFVEVVRIAREAGLVKMGTIAVDSTKLKANASKHKAMSYERMKAEEARLAGEIRTILEAARRQDTLEDGQFGPDFRGDELPQELAHRETRLKKIQEAKKRLEERKKEEAERSGAAERYERQRKSDDEGKGVRGRPFELSPGEPKPKDQENFTDPDSRIMKSGG